MSIQFSKNTTRLINVVIKLTVIGMFVWLIQDQILQKDNLPDIQRLFWEYWHGPQRYWLITVCLLMPVNWWLEMLKWRSLEERVEHLSWWQYIQATLSGITFSIFTPNRIGEYAGRILYVKPQNQARTVIATFVSTFAQWLVLLSFGYMGLVYALNHYLHFDVVITRGLYMFTFLLIGFMSICYYNISLVVKIARRIPKPQWMKKYVYHVRILKSYNAAILSQTLTYATLRYIVYTLQYLFMLRFFGVDSSFVLMLSGIATVYLIQTSIPLDPITGLLMRGEIAVLIWEKLGADSWRILGGTFGLWIINLLIPAIIGLLFILNLNIMRSLGYSDDTDT